MGEQPSENSEKNLSAWEAIADDPDHQVVDWSVETMQPDAPEEQAMGYMAPEEGPTRHELILQSIQETISNKARDIYRFLSDRNRAEQRDDAAAIEADPNPERRTFAKEYLGLSATYPSSGRPTSVEDAQNFYDEYSAYASDNGGSISSEHISTIFVNAEDMYAERINEAKEAGDMGRALSEQRRCAEILDLGVMASVNQYAEELGKLKTFGCRAALIDYAKDAIMSEGYRGTKEMINARPAKVGGYLKVERVRRAIEELNNGQSTEVAWKKLAQSGHLENMDWRAVERFCERGRELHILADSMDARQKCEKDLELSKMRNIALERLYGYRLAKESNEIKTQKIREDENIQKAIAAGALNRKMSLAARIIGSDFQGDETQLPAHTLNEVTKPNARKEHGYNLGKVKAFEAIYARDKVAFRNDVLLNGAPLGVRPEGVVVDFLFAQFGRDAEACAMGDSGTTPIEAYHDRIARMHSDVLAQIIHIERYIKEDKEKYGEPAISGTNAEDIIIEPNASGGYERRLRLLEAARAYLREALDKSRIDDLEQPPESANEEMVDGAYRTA